MPRNEPRLRVVDPDRTVTGEPAADEVTEQQATVFAALVAQRDHEAVSHTLDQMNAGQLRSLALMLAHQVNAAETAEGDVADVGPEGVCAIAVAEAAKAFGTTREAMLSADRHRSVTDARAVAMTAARRTGMTLPAIGAFFGRDHTSVMYAQNKVANNPRLNAVCVRIIDRIDDHYVDPTSLAALDPAPAGEVDRVPRRSSTLQLAALTSSASSTDDRQHHDARALHGSVATSAPGR